MAGKTIIFAIFLFAIIVQSHQAVIPQVLESLNLPQFRQHVQTSATSAADAASSSYAELRSLMEELRSTFNRGCGLNLGDASNSPLKPLIGKGRNILLGEGSLTSIASSAASAASAGSSAGITP